VGIGQSSDWGFLRRVAPALAQGALITILWWRSPCFVDLMVAVGVGIFLANIITIDKMNSMQTRAVKSVLHG